MADWIPLDRVPGLREAPSRRVTAALGTRLKTLPFGDLDWPDFERLIERVVSNVRGLRSVHIYGEPGQAQRGIDILGKEVDGSGLAVQVKKVKTFSVPELVRAIGTFTSTTRPFDVDEFVISVARNVRRTQIIDTLEQARRDLSPTKVELWDAEALSKMLRNRPDVLVEFFSYETVRAFCGDFAIQRRVVPTPANAQFLDAVARGPERATGAAARFEAASGADAAEALRLIEEGQQLLVDQGFAPHAAKQDKKKFELLVELGRAPEASGLLRDQLWDAIDRHRPTTAHFLQNQLHEVARLAPGDHHVEGHTRATDLALGLYMNPTGATPPLDTLEVDEPGDTARLALLAGETAAAQDNMPWLRDESATLLRLSSTHELDELSRTRLRILSAEGSGNWDEILAEARRMRLGYGAAALVHARFARWNALRENTEEADAAWEDAARSAALGGHWREAGKWTFSRRQLRSYLRPRVPHDLFELQLALDKEEASAPLLKLGHEAHAESLEELLSGKHRSAALSAQRALRESVVTADWPSELAARKTLAAIFEGSGEFRAAAHHYARAAALNEVAALAEKSGTYLDVLDDLRETNYWTVGCTYRLLAEQADLIPDEDIPRLSAHILAELDRVNTDGPQGTQGFATSRYGNALKALAGVALRIDDTTADLVLQHFERQPELDRDHGRFHDREEAWIVAAIAMRHVDLAHRAIPHLISLLNRSQRAQSTAMSTPLEKHLEITVPLLTELATQGQRWATVELALLQPAVVPDEAIAEAIRRLDMPLVHVPGQYTYGTDSVGNSLLACLAGASDVEPLIRELLKRVGDPKVAILDRQQYLIAASNLCGVASTQVREEAFRAAIHVIGSPAPSEADELGFNDNHPLALFRTEGMPQHCRGEALFLAAKVATSIEQKEALRAIAYRILDDDTDFWLARALHVLGPDVKHDLGFLVNQGPAVRRLAAELWAADCAPDHLGAWLADDADPSVRATLAHFLLARGDGAGAELLEVLARDSSFRVRDAATRID